MKRLAAVIGAVLLLCGCSAQEARSTAEQRLDDSGPDVARAQSKVEQQRVKVQKAVKEYVEPRLPEALRDGSGYDPASVEQFLVVSEGPAFKGVGKVGSARCPESLGSGKIRCTLEVSGSEVPYDVAVTKGAQPTATATRAAVVVPTAALVTLVGATKGATVTCGRGGLLVAQVGQSVSCRTELGAQTNTFTATVIDAAGHVTIS